VRKFFAVKTIVFATYWQALLILGLSGMNTDDGNKWNDFILCIEMLFFAIIHLKFFPWQEFRTDIPDRQALSNMKGVLSLVDVANDIRYSFKPSQKEYILNGAISDQGQVSYKTKTWEMLEGHDLSARTEESRVDVQDFKGEEQEDSVRCHNYGAIEFK